MSRQLFLWAVGCGRIDVGDSELEPIETVRLAFTGTRAVVDSNYATCRSRYVLDVNHCGGITPCKRVARTHVNQNGVMHWHWDANNNRLGENEATDATGPFCFRTTFNLAGWGCSNFDGRTMQVNDVARTCGQMPVPTKVNGFYYFDATAGAYAWASVYWW